ncbi:MAG: type II toxin-antitoxin system HipA family toxin [Sandaracinaceae bacterium]
MQERSTPLDALRHTERADVYKKGHLAATLSRTKTGTELQYRSDYVGPPLASTLPVDAHPVVHTSGALPPFFAGLLPEGRRLLALSRAVKTSADDELTLLLAVGRDTIGDVQVVPEGEPPVMPEPLIDENDLSSLRFDDLFADETGARVDRVAIPGVQDKVSASQKVSFPVGAGGGRYILKLTPREYPHLVENEMFFLQHARRSGIDTAEARVVVDSRGASGLLVTRFDRRTRADGTVELLTQEDGCQAAGRYPAQKYLLSTEDTIGALSRLTAAPLVTARELIRQVAFAYLTGNGDMHAKNLSVVDRDGEMRAAPAYDIPSTHPYGDTTMAMTVDGRGRENITRASFVAMGAAVGVPEKAVHGVIDGLLRRFDGVLDDLDTLPFDPRKRHGLRRLMLDRKKKLTG